MTFIDAVAKFFSNKQNLQQTPKNEGVFL